MTRKDIYRIDLIDGEDTLTTPSGRWTWVRVLYTDGKCEGAYYHNDCDVMTDRSGHCIACGADSPAVV